jgi:hypothetical protein
MNLRDFQTLNEKHCQQNLVFSDPNETKTRIQFKNITNSRKIVSLNRN